MVMGSIPTDNKISCSESFIQNSSSFPCEREPKDGKFSIPGAESFPSLGQKDRYMYITLLKVELEVVFIIVCKSVRNVYK